MAGAAKGQGSSRTGAKALDDVKTQHEAEAKRHRRTAGVKAESAGRRAAGADPDHDSPKRQGDKLERARDAAAGLKTR
jgi:hypothetical protein